MKQIAEFKYLAAYFIIRDVIKGNIEGKRSLGRRRLQILDDLREKREYWELKDEAQEREPWRKKFAVFHCVSAVRLKQKLK